MPILTPDDLIDFMSSYRLEHVKRVAALMNDLADHYGVNKDDAMLAGLAHDIAKEFNPTILRDRAPDLLDYYEDDYHHYPALWHGFVAPELLKSLFNIDNFSVFEAIRTHSTGAANMPLLSQLLYVADYCEPGRSFPTDSIRSMAFIDINNATAMVSSEVLNRLHIQGSPIHPNTEDCLRFYESYK